MENLHLPNCPDQWYNRDGHRLFRAEVEAMNQLFPGARLGFLQSSGNMYWVVELKPGSEAVRVKEWRFMLVYNKDYGSAGCQKISGGISVCFVKPCYEELKQMMEQAGVERSAVPHTYQSREYGALASVEPRETETGTRHTAAYYAQQMYRWTWCFEGELAKGKAFLEG